MAVTWRLHGGYMGAEGDLSLRAVAQQKGLHAAVARVTAVANAARGGGHRSHMTATRV